MRNRILTQSIEAVMLARSPAQLLLDLTLISKSNSNFTYTPLIIDSLKINQDFAHSYTDSIIISFEIASADYANIQDNIQNLMAVLTFTSVDSIGRVVYTPAPHKLTYRATIVNPKDVRRQLSDVASRSLPDTTIELRLIEQTIYDLRHIEINGIYQTTTLAEVLTHLAQSFNFKTLHLVPPDNTHVYDHIIIPPSKGFDEVFTYLQSTYGVYMKGLNFYGSGGILYIYPPYETKPVFPQTCVVYQADDGAFAGASSFHKTTGSTTEIVVNRESQSQDLTISAGENKGTASMFLRSSALVDGVVYVDPTTGPQYQSDVAATLRLQQPRLAQINAHNSSYVKATDNPFSMATSLAAGQALMLKADWAHAIPLLLQPGCAVRYSYDHNGAQLSQTGILEGAQYSLHRNARGSFGIIYVCSGSLMFRLQPNSAKTA